VTDLPAGVTLRDAVPGDEGLVDHFVRQLAIYEKMEHLATGTPEMFARALFGTPPRVFAMFWAMVHPFLDARTASKVTFLSARDPLKARDVLASVFEDLSMLERSLGGDSPDEFNHAEYGARMRAEDAAEARAIAAQVAAAQQGGAARWRSVGTAGSA
jgi:hypothetical protein